MLIKRASDIRSSEITDKKLYVNRREFLQTATGTARRLPPACLAARRCSKPSPRPHGRKLENVKKSPLSTDEKPNTWEADHHLQQLLRVRHDNDPGDVRAELQARAVDDRGRRRVRQEGTLNLEDIMKGQTLEERIYRHRCVEALVDGDSVDRIPAVGFIKQCEPTSKAKFVEFTTLNDPKQMPGDRVDRAAVAVRRGSAHGRGDASAGDSGGRPVRRGAAEQNGAPLRLVVPWKYGFKRIKSIVKVRFVEKQPLNTWQEDAPNEYGFYANVNPSVDHPRWSQANERRIGEFFRARRSCSTATAIRWRLYPAWT